MKKHLILIVCLIICIFNLNAITYDVYNTGVQNNTYTSIPYVPFNSTSPNKQIVKYNTVKPLNFDGTVSMEYTTFKGVYKPRYVKNGLGDIDDDDDPVGGVTPIGGPIIPLLMLMLLYIGYKRIIKLKIYK